MFSLSELLLIAVLAGILFKSNHWQFFLRNLILFAQHVRLFQAQIRRYWQTMEQDLQCKHQERRAQRADQYYQDTDK